MLLLRVAQVPVMLSLLEVEEYGRWLLLTSIPTWLTLANLGFGNVAGNELSLLVAGGKHEEAKSLYSTALALVTLIVGVGTTLIALAAWWFPWTTLLKVPATRQVELSVAVILLALSILLFFYVEIFIGRFWAARKPHYAVLLCSFRGWLELTALFAISYFSVRFHHLAAASVAATVTLAAIAAALSHRALPSLVFSARAVAFYRFRSLFPKGLAFQAVPLGRAIIFQGFLLVIQVFLGPAQVAVFATARTLIRSVNQMIEMVNHVIWPEMTQLLGAHDLGRAARLHRAGVAASFAAACAGCLLLFLLGDVIFRLWTGGEINLPRQLLILFLVPIPFHALWYASGVVHFASNQHEGLALRLVIGSCVAIAVCTLLVNVIGISGAALATLTVDLLLVRYVLERSLDLTGDSWPDFLRGIALELKSAPSAAMRIIR